MIHRAHRGDTGSVSVEFALALPAVVVVLGVVMAVVNLGLVTVQAADAASVGARVAARDGDAAARDAVVEVAGGAAVTITRDDGWVRARVDLPGPLGMSVTRETVAREEK